MICERLDLDHFWINKSCEVFRGGKSYHFDNTVLKSKKFITFE